MSVSVSSAVDSTQLPFNVDNTIGALLIGSLFAAAFWGVTNVQTYIYYKRYPNDPIDAKLIVAILWILDTFDACLTSHIVYHYLVTNYMNPASVTIPVWSVIVHTTVTTVTDALIRCLFTKRMWGLSNRNLALVSVVWIISLGDLILGLIISVKAFHLTSWAQLQTLAPLFYANFTTSLTGDLYVAVVLSYYLFKSRTGLRRTDTLVNTLIAYVITTGLLTSIDCILGTTLFAVMPTNFIFLAFYFNLAKLYVNSYLALLNARRHFCRDDRMHSFQITSLPSAPHDSPGFSQLSIDPASKGVLTKTTYPDVEIATHAMVEEIQDSDASTRVV